MASSIFSHAPIGVFDSGIGGLTVTNALIKALPSESIVYFGDTAHMPYGDKSAAAIQSYSVKITHLLLEQNCKLILIACHSAAAAAYESVKEYVNGRALVVNVVDPLIDFLATKFLNKRIGLIGTKQTVHSNIYQRKLQETQAGIVLHAYATNLLAPAIEEFGNHPILDHLLKVYFEEAQFQDLDAFVLACTHYPIIKSKLVNHLSEQTQLIDAAEIVALTVKKQLSELGLLSSHETPSRHFYISDYTDSFAKNTKLFFDEPIKLEHYPLWD